jgi:hypothetical protein
MNDKDEEISGFEKSVPVLPREEVEEVENDSYTYYKLFTTFIVATFFYVIGMYFGSYLGGRLHP